MPYTVKNPPDEVKEQSPAVIKAWVAAFNSARKVGKPESECRVAAWAVVAANFEKDKSTGKWEPKKTTEMHKAILSLEAQADAPEWFCILPAGKVEIADGRDPFLVDEAGMEAVIDAFKKRGNDLVIDYEHQTSYSDQNGVEAPAAGWIKTLEARGDGLWAKVEWTEKARSYIQNKEYRYFSPVITLQQKTRRVQELLHAALTNFPAIANLTPLSLKYGADLEVLVLANSADKKVQEDKEKSRGEVLRMLEKLRKLLGLADDADETTIILKVQEVQGVAGRVPDLEKDLEQVRENLKTSQAETVGAKNEALQLQLKVNSVVVPMTITQAVGLPVDAKTEQVITRIEGYKNEVETAKTAQKELAELKASNKKAEGDRLIQEALKAGKTSPEELARSGERLQKMAYEDSQFFKDIVMARPDYSVVPLEKINLKTETTGAVELTDDELTMCKQMGLDPEKFKESKKQLEQLKAAHK